MLKGLVKIKIFDKIVAYKKNFFLVKNIFTRNYFNLIKLISKLLIKIIPSISTQQVHQSRSCKSFKNESRNLTRKFIYVT